MANLAEGFVVIGDSHIVHDVDNLKITNMYDSLYSLQQAVNYCLKKRKALVIAGDLFDKNQFPSRLLDRVRSVVEPLTEQGVPVYGIQGNHDKDPSYPWFMHIKGAKWLSNEPTNVGGHMLCGLDFAPSAAISEALTTIPKCDGLVLHQALRQGLGFEGSWNCDLDWVINTQAVWLGDLHNCRDEYWSKDKKVRGIYTTSQYMTKADESDEPSFLDVAAVEKLPAYTRVALKHRPIYKFHIDSDDSFNEAIDQMVDYIMLERPELPEEVRRPSFLVTHYADIPGVVQAIESITEGGKLAVLHDTALPSRSQTFFLGRNLLKAEEGLTLPKLVADRTDGELQAFMMDIVSARDVESVRGVLTVWREKIQKGERHEAEAAEAN